MAGFIFSVVVLIVCYWLLEMLRYEKNAFYILPLQLSKMRRPEECRSSHGRVFTTESSG